MFSHSFVPIKHLKPLHSPPSDHRSISSNVLAALLSTYSQLFVVTLTLRSPNKALLILLAQPPQSLLACALCFALPFCARPANHDRRRRYGPPDPLHHLHKFASFALPSQRSRDSFALVNRQWLLCCSHKLTRHPVRISHVRRQQTIAIVVVCT